MVGTIPTVITGISLAQLISSGTFDTVASGLFSLPILSQISLFAILFSIVFLAVAISQFLDPDEHHHSHDPPPAPIKYPLSAISAATNERDRFLALYPHIRGEILAHLSSTHELIPEATGWVEAMMDYTVPGGKLNRGLTVLQVQRTLIQSSADRELTPTEVARASVLGWAIEFLQAFFLVADDVMDDSQTRRNQPCWYKRSEVGNIAINDSFLLESFVFFMIDTHFKMEDYHPQLIHLFHQVVLQTEIGQLLDLTSQKMVEGKPQVDLDRFTIDRYQKIVKYKTAFYTFYLPVAIGMITSGVEDTKAFDVAKKICCTMGEYFQIQDDYLDCFGDPEVIGKVGTDIQDNKCSWLVVQALNRATPSQRTVIEQNYGVWDDAKVLKIKAIYRDLNMPDVFTKYEEESYKAIQEELDSVTQLPRDVFELLLKKIYKRSK